MLKTKAGMLERILDRFVSPEARILADHLHRPLEDENNYFGVAREIFTEGEFSVVDFLYLRLAAQQNMVQDTKNHILLNVLEVDKLETSPMRLRRKS